MTQEQHMTSYEHFCDFTWGHLEDVFEIEEPNPLPSRTPYLEFIKGCAFSALGDFSEPDQEQIFGFTLENLTELTQRFEDQFIQL